MRSEESGADSPTPSLSFLQHSSSGKRLPAPSCTVGIRAPSRLIRIAITGEESIGGVDEQDFAHLVHRYLRKAMAVAMEYCDSLDDAEDVVQETFRRVADGLPGFDSTRPFDPWFFTILRNTARNWAKSRRVRAHEELSADHESERPGPGEDADRRELRQQLDNAISRLPPMQQTCFRLCLVEGLSSQEAADAMGLAESTVRVHVMRARQALRVQLAGWGDDWEEQ